MSQMRMNQWFVPGDGIAREVITADIQRYLGPDALVRPGPGTGEHEGRPGYWITAYRTLTSQMIQDLKLDSQRWRAEKDVSQRGHGSGVNYQDSKTHASRQHYGPSAEGYAATSRTTGHTPTYGSTSEPPHYTTTPTPSYTAYGQPAHPHTQPRTTDPYYGQTTPVRTDYPSAYTTTPTYTYPQQTQDPYGRPTQSTPYATPQQPSLPQQPAPGFYYASDGRQYPLPQQQQQQPPHGRRGN